MGEFLAKLSSYNLFNYLLPGAVFMFFATQLGIWELADVNIVVELFLYYFVGMTISRVGSVLIEPIFTSMKIVHYAEYNHYLDAKDSDPQIEILLEQNNTYRTITALFLLLGVAYGLDRLVVGNYVSEVTLGWSLFVGLFVLYVFAFRKQTTYIKRRVDRKTD